MMEAAPHPATISPPSHHPTAPKRKRSISDDGSSSTQHVHMKHPKTPQNHLQINYLIRQNSEDIPLITAEDSLPTIISLINQYDDVLGRHESIAGNMGARPLGPILVKRFERLFAGPPRILKTHGKDGASVTWLDVIDFARNKPEQFNLDQTHDGVRVCQFWTKQSRVEISEEDYLLIAAGIPQKLIPPQPIEEDEQKELGALEILEKNIYQVIQLADHVSTRARQLNHRLRNRKTAINSRRAIQSAADDASKTSATKDDSPYSPATVNGSAQGSSFVAVNSLPRETRDESIQSRGSHGQSTGSQANGLSKLAAAEAVREELLTLFKTTSQLRHESLDKEGRSSFPSANHAVSARNKSKHRSSTPAGLGSGAHIDVLLGTGNGPAAVTPTPPSHPAKGKHSPAPEKEDAGPFKAEILARLEMLNKGDRIVPPCDRCRRLQMDCQKNLTACVKCTAKHAKCSWRQVKEEELRASDAIMDQQERQNGPGPEEPQQELADDADMEETPRNDMPESDTRDTHEPENQPGLERGMQNPAVEQREDPLANIPIYRQPGAEMASGA